MIARTVAVMTNTGREITRLRPDQSTAPCLTETAEMLLSELSEVARQMGHGRHVIPNHEAVLVRHGSIRLGGSFLHAAPNRVGHCYRNAQRHAAASDGALTYVEGYGMFSDMPVPIRHGWVEDENGHVLDPTWRDAPNSVYLGIGFEPALLRRLAKKTNGWSVLFDDYLNDWHLMRSHRQCCLANL